MRWVGTSRLRVESQIRKAISRAARTMRRIGIGERRRRGGGEIRMAGLLPHETGRCIAPAAMAETPHQPPLRLDRPIVLVGLMGAGKSTVGRRLAKRLGLPFVDSDDEIERAADHSIGEIFDRFGEASFRDGERRVIRRLVGGPPAVLATGGGALMEPGNAGLGPGALHPILAGAFMEPATRALILERCIAIWLDAEAEILAERVQRRSARPLLRDKDPLPLLRELAAARNPVYAEAHLHVRSEGGPHDAAVDRIVEALAERERAA